ncbi:aspartic peptidase domain-containing protein [Immersiella caudata]|uniref:Aspartic peptidase domain-containing protein n=1 Tax=Immersiella caudata TaxID=314043 RepID=A0AA39T1C8_9PEZI|nr:aspartic peptidase domain-containing protein [Immersiella caudata]
MTIHRQSAPEGLPVRRRGTVRAPFHEELGNNLTVGAYFAEVEVGTPGQKMTLHIDTGSTDVWLLSKSADLCNLSVLQALYGQCKDTFDRSTSSTYETLSTNDFKIRYMDGSGAEGDFFLDHINVGGLNVSEVQMGLAKKATSSWGMLGIGYNTNSVSREIYPSIVDQMYNQGLIGIKAYSLYLNDLEAKSGTILFGGIDTEKFTGTLKSIPVLPEEEYGYITHFNVSLTSLATTSDVSGNSNNFIPPSGVPVILDSGTTYTYLPREVTAPLFSRLNAVDRSLSFSNPIVYVDCALLDTDPNLFIEYQFDGPDGPKIKVSIADIVFNDIQPYVDSGALATPSLPFPKNRACSLGIMTSQTGDVHLLGDTFLRSAYVVYDLSNDRVALAQSYMNATGSNIIEIARNASGVPLATGQLEVVPTGVPKAKENGATKETFSMGGLVSLGLLAAIML